MHATARGQIIAMHGDHAALDGDIAHAGAIVAPDGQINRLGRNVLAALERQCQRFVEPPVAVIDARQITELAGGVGRHLPANGLADLRGQDGDRLVVASLIDPHFGPGDPGRIVAVDHEIDALTGPIDRPAGDGQHIEARLGAETIESHLNIGRRQATIRFPLGIRLDRVAGNMGAIDRDRETHLRQGWRRQPQCQHRTGSHCGKAESSEIGLHDQFSTMSILMTRR